VKYISTIEQYKQRPEFSLYRYGSGNLFKSCFRAMRREWKKSMLSGVTFLRSVSPDYHWKFCHKLMKEKAWSELFGMEASEITAQKLEQERRLLCL
jgi:hypothetical protein